MQRYLETPEQVLQELDTTAQGLSNAEAAARLEKYGKNKLAEAKKESLAKRFLKALCDPMIFMLLGAALISTLTTVYQNLVQHENESYADLFIILFVVIINTVLSVVQEGKAAEAIDALMEMTVATSKIMRDGLIKVIRSEDVVVGDVVVLEAGDAVPADCRILESYSMKAEESALTGESVPVNKLVDALMLSGGQKSAFCPQCSETAEQ